MKTQGAKVGNVYLEISGNSKRVKRAMADTDANAKRFASESKTGNGPSPRRTALLFRMSQGGNRSARRHKSAWRHAVARELAGERCDQGAAGRGAGSICAPKTASRRRALQSAVVSPSLVWGRPYCGLDWEISDETYFDQLQPILAQHAEADIHSYQPRIPLKETEPHLTAIPSQRRPSTQTRKLILLQHTPLLHSECSRSRLV